MYCDNVYHKTEQHITLFCMYKITIMFQFYAKDHVEYEKPNRNDKKWEEAKRSS